jgi:hypothetical protein
MRWPVSLEANLHGPGCELDPVRAIYESFVERGHGLTPIRGIYRMPPPLSGGGFVHSVFLMFRFHRLKYEVGHEGH